MLLGNYIYDRENRYGGKFFCVPHFGLSVRSRGIIQKAEKDIVSVKDEEQAPKVQTSNLLNKVSTSYMDIYRCFLFVAAKNFFILNYYCDKISLE